jgi:C4-dicarboxylate-specific signal transduction histidine kinase
MTAKVLFVDDDEANLVVCEAVCSDEFDVLVAADAVSALELMRSNEVGVIISDQRMPEMTGVELLEVVRERHPEAVRLLITAYSNTPAAVDAINRGQVRRYLKKPWEPQELKAEVRQALEWYHTQRRIEQLERRLTQTERVYSLGVIAAGIGHELKNPISWITGNLEHTLLRFDRLRKLAEEPNIDPSALRREVDQISDTIGDAKQGADRVCEIVQGIKMSVVQPSAEVVPVDLEEVLRLTLRLVSGELRRRARVAVNASGHAFVRGSSTQLSQIVLNLLVNALQAVNKDEVKTKQVAVRLFREGPNIRLEVADSGSGVPEEDRERIFDPFFTTKPGVGSGLGLAISRKIAEDFGGSLGVSRDRELGGAVFQLSLPHFTEGLPAS